MDKMFFGIFAAAGAAFSALGPAGFDSSMVVAPRQDIASSVRIAWRQDASGRRCRVEMRWRHDYSGQPYVNKVRICA